MKCPTCFAWLSASPSAMVCTGSCPTTANDKASLVRGYEVRTKSVFDISPTDPTTNGQARCPACSSPTNQEVCAYCSGPIPLNWRSSTVTCVAMAGARATGKSLMLAVAKEQLQLLVERHHRSVLKGIGDTDRLFGSLYTKPLYEQRQLLQATATMAVPETPTREPMMFAFQEVLPDGGKRSRVLVLRDVAGEDLEELGGMDRHLTFFSRADAVIALLDPLRVRQINAMLADLIPGDTLVGGDGVEVLRHVLGLMTQHVPGARTRIPLAVVLSKVDTLQRLREVEDFRWSSIMNRPGSPLQRDPSLRSAHFDADDGALLHEEVRGLLELLQAPALTAMLEETADTFHYFAASALGASPEGDLIHSGGIAPFRVLDAFKWALQVST